MFADEASKGFLLHFVCCPALEQDLFRHVLVRIFVVALNPRDLAVHIWVVVTSYQGHPAERKKFANQEGIEGKFLPSKHAEAR